MGFLYRTTHERLDFEEISVDLSILWKLVLATSVKHQLSDKMNADGNTMPSNEDCELSK